MNSRLAVLAAAAGCLLAAAPVAATAPVAIAAPVAGPVSAGTEEPSGELAPATAASGLSLSVNGGEGRVVAGREVTYEVEVFNGGDEPVSVTVRASVPMRMVEVMPLDGGAADRGAVEWTLAVAAGAVAVVRVVGTFGRPEPADQDQTVRVAFTACAIDAADDQPVICATDIAELATQSGWGWWIAGAVLAVGAAAAAGGALLRSRRRKVADDLPAGGPAEPARVVEPST